MRLIQLRRTSGQRRVGIVDAAKIRVLAEPASIHALALSALAAGVSLSAAASNATTGETLDYDEIHSGASKWQVLPAMDHPDDPARCLVTGTGLTHLAGAKNRDSMHVSAGGQVETPQPVLTDSMRMYQWGVEGGRPAEGQIGVSPEWFYKGNGAVLRAHNEPLDIPAHAEDGGEEPELAGVYVIGPDGEPRRIGMAIGNEFSDHKFEKRNYLYLAGSKLMTCAIGPELTLDPDFRDVQGKVAIERSGAALWLKEIRTGDAAMCHTLANMEHHHFKHAAHRRPGDVHVHYFGTSAFSFGEGITLQDGDVMQVEFAGYGRPLRNTVRVASEPLKSYAARPL
jgi:hypothetical protein